MLSGRAEEPSSTRTRIRCRSVVGVLVGYRPVIGVPLIDLPLRVLDDDRRWALVARVEWRPPDARPLLVVGAQVQRGRACPALWRCSQRSPWSVAYRKGSGNCRADWRRTAPQEMGRQHADIGEGRGVRCVVSPASTERAQVLLYRAGPFGPSSPSALRRSGQGRSLGLGLKSPWRFWSAPR